MNVSQSLNAGFSASMDSLYQMIDRTKATGAKAKIDGAEVQSSDAESRKNQFTDLQKSAADKKQTEKNENGQEVKEEKFADSALEKLLAQKFKQKDDEEKEGKGDEKTDELRVNTQKAEARAFQQMSQAYSQVQYNADMEKQTSERRAVSA